MLHVSQKIATLTFLNAKKLLHDLNWPNFSILVVDSVITVMANAEVCLYIGRYGNTMCRFAWMLDASIALPTNVTLRKISKICIQICAFGSILIAKTTPPCF